MSVGLICDCVASAHGGRPCRAYSDDQVRGGRCPMCGGGHHVPCDDLVLPATSPNPWGDCETCGWHSSDHDA